MAEVFKIDNQGQKATIVVTGKDFEDVTSSTVKKMVVDEGTKLFGLCGISGSSGPYPVDDNGEEIANMDQLATLSKQGVTFKYHNDYSIMQSLGL